MLDQVHLLLDCPPVACDRLRVQIVFVHLVECVFLDLFQKYFLKPRALLLELGAIGDGLPNVADNLVVSVEFVDHGLQEQVNGVFSKYGAHKQVLRALEIGNEFQRQVFIDQSVRNLFAAIYHALYSRSFHFISDCIFEVVINAEH